MKNRKFTLDESVFILIGAPAIFFFWFVITGLGMIAVVSWVAIKLKKIGVDITKLPSLSLQGENATVTLSLAIAIVISVILTYRSMIAGWPTPPTQGKAGECKDSINKTLD